MKVEKRRRQCGGTTFREGDSVMQIKNNYDIEWEQNGFIGSRNFQWGNGKNSKNKQYIRICRNRL